MPICRSYGSFSLERMFSPYDLVNVNLILLSTSPNVFPVSFGSEFSTADKGINSNLSIHVSYGRKGSPRHIAILGLVVCIMSV